MTKKSTTQAIPDFDLSTPEGRRAAKERLAQNAAARVSLQGENSKKSGKIPSKTKYQRALEIGSEIDPAELNRIAAEKLDTEK
jgi:hypothetical protein